MGKLIRVQVKGIVAPNEFIVSMRKGRRSLEDQVNEMELNMLSDWSQLLRERLEGWKPTVHEDVLVLDPTGNYGCCRGVVTLSCPLKSKEFYVVFLYDHGVQSIINKDFICSLPEKYKILQPRSFVIRIPGIVPAKAAIRGSHGISYYDLNEEERDRWAAPAFEVTKSWVELNEGNIKISVVKEVNRILVLGDLMSVSPETSPGETYCDYLCNKKVSDLSREQYDESISKGWEANIHVLDNIIPLLDASDSATWGDEKAAAKKEKSDSYLTEEGKSRNRGNKETPSQGKGRDVSSRLNSESDLFRMAVAGQSCLTAHRVMKLKAGTATSNNQVLAMPGISRNAGVVVADIGQPPLITPTSSIANDSSDSRSDISSSEDGSDKGNLFKRLYDPDNCFDNVYKQCPAPSPVLDSGSKDTVKFTSAKVQKSAKVQESLRLARTKRAPSSPSSHEVSVVTIVTPSNPDYQQPRSDDRGRGTVSRNTEYPPANAVMRTTLGSLPNVVPISVSPPRRDNYPDSSKPPPSSEQLKRLVTPIRDSTAKTTSQQNVGSYARDSSNPAPPSQHIPQAIHRNSAPLPPRNLESLREGSSSSREYRHPPGRGHHWNPRRHSRGFGNKASHPSNPFPDYQQPRSDDRGRDTVSRHTDYSPDFRTQQQQRFNNGVVRPASVEENLARARRPRQSTIEADSVSSPVQQPTRILPRGSSIENIPELKHISTIPSVQKGPPNKNSSEVTMGGTSSTFQCTLPTWAEKKIQVQSQASKDNGMNGTAPSSGPSLVRRNDGYGAAPSLAPSVISTTNISLTVSVQPGLQVRQTSSSQNTTTNPSVTPTDLKFTVTDNKIQVQAPEVKIPQPSLLGPAAVGTSQSSSYPVGKRPLSVHAAPFVPTLTRLISQEKKQPAVPAMVQDGKKSENQLSKLPQTISKEQGIPDTPTPNPSTENSSTTALKKSENPVSQFPQTSSKEQGIPDTQKSDPSTENSSTAAAKSEVELSAAKEKDPVVSHTSDESYLMKMVEGRSFVYGSLPSEPYTNLMDLPYFDEVKAGIQSNDLVKATTSTQNYVMPNILRGRNMFIVDNDRTGKSLAYMIPVVSRIMREGRQLCDKAKATKVIASSGPLAVFVTASITRGSTLKNHLDTLLDSKAVKETVGYFVIRNDMKTEQELEKKACHIMITTPECLLEMIESMKSYFSFDRLLYLVIDDAHILVNTKPGTLLELMHKVKHGLVTRGPREFAFQLIFAASSWSPALKSAMDMVEAPILVLGPLQAAVFGEVKTLVEYVKDDGEKQARFLDYIGSVIADPKDSNRIIVVCEKKETVQELQKKVLELHKFKICCVLQISRDDPVKVEEIRRGWTSASESDLQVVACTDAVVKELKITDAVQIIHYDFPSKPKFFGPRFCTMWARLQGCKEVKPKPELISRLFLTSTQKGMVEIVTILKELNAKLPAEFQKDFLELKKLKDEAQWLCSGLLRYGFCDKEEPSKCEQRHYALESDITKTSCVPKIGQVEIRVVKTETLSCYIAQLLRYYDYQDGKMKLAHDYEKEMKERCGFLAEYYSEEKNKVPVTSLSTGECAGVWDAGAGNYLRVAIEAHIKKDKHLGNVIRLFCLDTGRTLYRKADADELYALPEGYGKDMSSFAVEVILSNMKPPMGERSFLVEHKSKASRMNPDGMVLTGRVCLTVGPRIWVDQLVELGADECGKRYQKRSVRMEYFKLKYAENNPEHMSTLYKMYEKVGLSCTVYEHLGTSRLDHDFVQRFHQKADPIQWAHLSLSTEDDPEYVSMYSSFVEDIGTIFCYHSKFTKQVDELLANMNKEIEELKDKKCSELTNLKKYYGVDMAVAAKDDDRWVRAIITDMYLDCETGENVYEVFLVDVGETKCDVVIEDLFPIPKTFVSKLPFQAVALKLSHVQPVNEDNKEWSPDVTSTACDFIFDEKGFCKLVDVVAYEKLDTPDVPLCNSYSAYIIVRDFELGEKMVEDKLAKFCEGREESAAKVMANLLKRLNNKVDAELSKGPEQEQEGGLQQEILHISNFSDNDDSDESCKFEFMPGPNFDPVKLLFGEDSSQKLPSLESAKSAESRSRSPAEDWSKRINLESTPFPDNRKTPSVTWSQNDNEIILQILIHDVKEYSIEVMDDKRTLVFLTEEPANYGFQIDLFKRVEQRPIQVTLLGAYVKVKLTKRFKPASWKQLTGGVKKYRWISKVSLEDDEESEEEEDGSSNQNVAAGKKREYCPVSWDGEDSESSDECEMENEELAHMIE